LDCLLNISPTLENLEKLSREPFEVNEKRFFIHNRIGGDHVARTGLLNHTGATSKFADPYSILPTSLFGKLGYFASFNLTRNVRDHILQNSGIGKYGILGPLNIPGEITDVIPGPFHEICRLVLNTVKWTLIVAQLKLQDSPLLRELITYLSEEGIKLNDNISYFQVSGNSGKKCAQILRKIPSLLNFFQDPLKTCMLLLWKECAWLCYFLSKLIPTEEEINKYYYHTLTYSYLMVTLFCENSITITIRTILDHNLYWIFEFQSMAIFLEECIEANHSLHNFWTFHSSMKNGGRGGVYLTNQIVLALDRFYKELMQELANYDLESTIDKKTNSKHKSRFDTDCKDMLVTLLQTEESFLFHVPRNVSWSSTPPQHRKASSQVPSLVRSSSLDSINHRPVPQNTNKDLEEHEDQIQLLDSLKPPPKVTRTATTASLGELEWISTGETKCIFKVLFGVKKFVIERNIDDRKEKFIFNFSSLASIKLERTYLEFHTLTRPLFSMKKEEDIKWQDLKESKLNCPVFKFHFTYDISIIQEPLINVDEGFKQLLSLPLCLNCTYESSMKVQQLLPNCSPPTARVNIVNNLEKSCKDALSVYQTIMIKEELPERKCISCNTLLRTLDDIKSHLICEKFLFPQSTPKPVVPFLQAIGESSRTSIQENQANQDMSISSHIQKRQQLTTRIQIQKNKSMRLSGKIKKKKSIGHTPSKPTRNRQQWEDWQLKLLHELKDNLSKYDVEKKTQQEKSKLKEQTLLQLGGSHLRKKVTDWLRNARRKKV
jgi:hypothetical protein